MQGKMLFMQGLWASSVMCSKKMNSRKPTKEHLGENRSCSGSGNYSE